MIRLIVGISVLWGISCLAACDKGEKQAKQEDLKIVVEADRSKIEKEEQLLNQRLSEFENERAELRKEKAELMSSLDVTKGKDKLQAQRLLELERKLWKKEREMWEREAALEKERDKVARSKSELLGKVSGSVAAVPAGDVAGRERSVAQREKGLSGREASLARREKDLAQREADLTKREAAFLKLQASLSSARMPVMPKVTGRGQTVSRAKVEKTYKGVLKRMRRYGILNGDLPLEAAGLIKEIEAAKKEGDFSKMMDLVEQLGAVVGATKVDAGFIDRKFLRLAQLTKERKPQGDKKQKVSTLLRKATQLYGDGKFALANSALNKIFALLTR